MGRWQEFPLPDGSYSDDTRPWSQQDVVNYLPTYAEMPGARSRVQYKPVPGMKLFATVGAGPHRGARDVEGKAFVVSGDKLYQVAPTGTATELGTIPGTGRVTMTHNQIADGNELVIGTVDNSYVWNTVTGTLTATGVGLASVDFLNQRILGIEPQRRFFRYSGLASATDWNDLDNEAAESSPDRIVGGIVSQGEWLVFGERTIEVWQNAPTESTAFQRGVVIEKGCANGNTIQRLDNSVIWLGNDFIVYRMQGYSPVPISTKAQAAAFRARGAGKAYAFTFEDNGYVVYYLTFRNGETWGYDVTNQRWHRRESFGLDRWRASTLFPWNGEWYAGDYRNGKLYRLAWGYVYEGCEIMPRSIRTGVMHDNGNRLRVHGLKMLVNTGAEKSVRGPECDAVTSQSFVALGNYMSGAVPSEEWQFLMPYREGSGYTLLSVDQQPAGVGRGGGWSPDGAHYACPHSGWPYITLYKRTDSGLVKLPTPTLTTASTFTGQSVAWTPDAQRMAFGMYGTNNPESPYVVVYARNGDGYSQVAALSDVTTGGRNVTALSYSGDGGLLALTTNQSAGLYVYSVNGDTYTKLPPLAGIPAGDSYDVAFSGNYLAYAHVNGVSVYKAAGTTLTNVATLSDGPWMNAAHVAWSPDGITLAGIWIGQYGRPILKAYTRSGDTFTLAASYHLTDNGTDLGTSIDPQGLTFTSTRLLVSFTGTNDATKPGIRAYNASGFARVPEDDVELPSPSAGEYHPAYRSLWAVGATTAIPGPSLDGGGYVELRYSNDGGNNYGNWKLRETGEAGQFLKPLVWRRLGLFKEQRIYEFRDTSDVPAEVLACYVDVESE